MNGGTDGLRVRSVVLRCLAASAAPLRVNIPAVNGTDFDYLAAGDRQEYACDGCGDRGPQLGEVNVKGEGGTATYSFSVTMQ